MYKISITLGLLFFCFMYGYSQQNSSTDESKIYKEQVKATILEFFEGFHQGDTSKISKTIDSGMVLQTIVTTKEGEIKAVKTDVQKFLTVIHKRPADQKWDERLLSFKIDANDGIANVWTPYEFYLNGIFSHCGVNVFQLYNSGTSWKIMALADTRRKEGCK
ncbi:nuclear transport factor 2 family protein [Aquimarina sp. D1M17]|uniref:nuclear transport factor 2 family protein n=1 Tax=Aquimarina acroporae TaxID=2937283 RepID=UPI0020C0C646|nr:nuclear transport factor 2 family protein [Aquimarina acroporae]MCK8524293.1 nuclear transport factor 2 family protein [Aquimarina acroporae]